MVLLWSTAWVDPMLKWVNIFTFATASGLILGRFLTTSLRLESLVTSQLSLLPIN